MTTEVLEGEIIEAESRAITVSETVSLPVPVEEVLRQWEQYQELTRKLLNETDYQKIGNKQFKKKSAWRKYARAFNITDRVTFEEISRFDDGFPRYARLRVEARAMNGRTAEADQECHVTERCCVQPCNKRSWKGHDCCDEDCNGKRHWSHAGDLPATALTRAKNRAISDLIGAGEVSAEEMEGTDQQERPAFRQPTVPPPSCPEHGTKFMQLVKAGKSKKTGNAYDAFWSCDKTCTNGKDYSGKANGKSYSKDAAAHIADLQLARGDAQPVTAEQMDDLPNE